MSLLRQALKAVVLTTAATLCGCSPPVPADCLAVRDPAATDCVVISGQDWYFGEGEQEPDYSQYCSAACIDFDGGVSVYLPSDLRTVPLLRKMRFIESLRISVDKLSDLSGLELIEASRLNLTGVDRTKTFTTLRGLNEKGPSTVSIADAPGLTSLEALTPRGLIGFNASNVGLVDVDFTGFDDLRLLNISNSDSLKSLRLPAGVMNSVGFSRNGNLSALDWGQGLSLEAASFVQNRSLSSCRIQEFIDAVRPDGGNRGLVTSNGPCP